MINKEKLGALFVSLAEIEQGKETDLTKIQARLEDVVMDIFIQVGRGNTNSLQEYLDVLRPVEAFAARHAPDNYEPKARAGIKAYEWMEVLRTIQEVFDKVKQEHIIEERLKEPLFREVVNVLISNRENYINVNKISDAIVEAGFSKVDRKKILSVLIELCSEGFVNSREFEVRKNRSTKYYYLNQRGNLLLERIGVIS